MKKSPPVHTIVMRHYQHVATAAELFFVREQGKSKLLSECQSLVNHNSLTKQTFLGAMLLNESMFLRSISLFTLHKQHRNLHTSLALIHVQFF